MPQTSGVTVGVPSGPVSLVRCGDYALEGVRAALREVLAPRGVKLPVTMLAILA